MIEKIHQANLEILLEVDRICRKHQIEYRLDAGTLIGAVRHQGFIPWDDDVDLAFLRKDYEKFLRIAPKELKKGLSIWFPDQTCGGKAFYDFTPKIIYENSRKCNPNSETAFYGEELNHLCVDLFVLDEIADGKFAQKIQILRMKIIYGMAMAHRYRLDFQKYRGISRLQVAILATAGKCFSMKRIYPVVYVVLFYNFLQLLGFFFILIYFNNGRRKQHVHKKMEKENGSIGAIINQILCI